MLNYSQEMMKGNDTMKKRLLSLLLAAVMLLALTGCFSAGKGILPPAAPSATPTPTPTPTPEPTIDPAMVISDEEIERMVERAKTAVITEEDADYFLDGASPILVDTQNLADLLYKVDANTIKADNTEEWKPLISEISAEAKKLCARFEALTPSANFEDFQRLMILGYTCYYKSMDLIIESEGQSWGKLSLAVDYMLRGNAYIQGANNIMLSFNLNG